MDKTLQIQQQVKEKKIRNPSGETWRNLAPEEVKYGARRVKNEVGKREEVTQHSVLQRKADGKDLHINRWSIMHQGPSTRAFIQSFELVHHSFYGW